MLKGPYIVEKIVSQYIVRIASPYVVRKLQYTDLLKSVYCFVDLVMKVGEKCVWSWLQNGCLSVFKNGCLNRFENGCLNGFQNESLIGL